MSTMKDVAREAGVSLGTVSNVLNNKPTVLAENRRKVMSAVKRLEFRSNLTARALKTKSSSDIGLIIPNINNPFYPELARGVEDAANSAGFTVLLCNVDRDVSKERDYINSLITKNVSGIILVKRQISLEEIDQVKQHMAVVLVDSATPPHSYYNVINVDDRDGVNRALAYLYDNGHRKIAFVKGLDDSLSSHDRFRAYTDFFRAKKMFVNKQFICEGAYSWNSGYEMSRRLLALSDPPTAILAANDLMAIGCMKAAQEMGLNVPGDVSVVGFDNLDITNLCSPPLTTINQPKYEIGMKSVELLLRCLQGGNGAATEKVILPTTFVKRESVGYVGVPQ